MGAPYPPVPNLLKVQVQGSIPGEIWENVLHFAYLGPPPSTSTCVTFAASVGSLWAQHVTPLQNTDTVQTQVIATDMGSVTGGSGVAVTSSPGTRSGGMVPANAAVLISYPSPSRFRGGHFRTYLFAGANTDLVNAMDWTSAFQSLVNTNWQAFIGTVIGVSAGGTQLTGLVGLRQHGKFLPNAGPPNFVLTTPVQLQLSATNIVVHQQVASQKGRIGRRSK